MAERFTQPTGRHVTIALALGGAAFGLRHHLGWSLNLATVIPAGISVAAIGVGFLATVKTLLRTAPNATVQRVERAKKAWRSIMTAIRHTIWGCLAVAGLGLLLLASPVINGGSCGGIAPVWASLLASVWFFSAGYAGSLALYALGIFFDLYED